ncbi:MAG: MazG nucleotide pyrophosphohydrolase domain-containing protein [Endomicrobiaceae bacterium]|nr:MazG nucleotide pyrophosphohydrolase domain-containing protein [Endomicrobiaceae bacterium]
MRKQNKETGFSELVDIFKKLRGKNGCVWDKKQTHETLIKYLFEESRELKKAILKKDVENMKEELGDVLLQVIFHAQIAKENKLFDIYDVIECLNKKMIRRHPHVFGKSKVKTEKDVIDLWKKIKKNEKKIVKKSL